LPGLWNSNRRFEIAPIAKSKSLKPLKYSARKALVDWLTTFSNGKNSIDSYIIKENCISLITRSSMLRSSRPATIRLLLGIPANTECSSLSCVITGGPK
jgi:hypothetical protein